MIDSVFKVVRGLIKLKGNTDGTKIGNRYDALKTTIQGYDGNHQVDVELLDGKRRMLTDAIVTVEEIFGQDPFPDSYFAIEQAGSAGDTIRVQIAGIDDPTGTDRDVPAVDTTYTLVAGDAGNEISLRDNIITHLNNHANFSASMKAQKAKDIAVVHVTSKFRSMAGEYYERPNSGDFTVTTTGTTVVTVGFDTILSRGKSTSLARDPDSPHRLGILGIAGSVTTTPGAVGDLITEYLKNSGSELMNVNGSVTPVVFSLLADATGAYDYFIQSISIHGQDNGIKYYANFLGMATLTNGITTIIVSEGETQIRKVLKRTEDLKHEWVRGLVSNYCLEFAPGADDVVATAVFDPPFRMVAGSSDKIEMTVRDDLSSVTSLHTLVSGFKKEV